MMMIQITDDKVNKMSDLCEEMLAIGGKLMSCIEQMGHESEMGERRHRGMIGMREPMGYGERYGNMGGMRYPYDETPNEDWSEYGDRRMRRRY